MKTYKNKGTVKAVRWFKHGDHPAVKPFDKSPGDYIPFKKDSAGCIEVEYDSVLFVFPGDYIVETEDGKITAFGPEEFESKYSGIVDWKFLQKPASVMNTIDRERALEIIRNEPEFPGEMPQEVTNRLEAIIRERDMVSLENLLRLTVRVTKQSILEQIEKEGGECGNKNNKR